MNRRHSGFTLVELMIVIAIVGILASVALPAYQDYVSRARYSEAIALAGAIREPVKEYYERWGELPRDNAAAGLGAPESYRTKVVRTIDVVDGLIKVQVTMSSGAAGAADTSQPGKTRFIYLQPAINEANPTGPLTWTCSGALDGAGPSEKGLEPKFLPGSCR